MTIRDYHVAMKGVGIAQLKARLSEHLRAVRKGHEVIVLDRNVPVARIVACQPQALEVRRATRRPRDLSLPNPPSAPTDSLTLLLDDRGRR